MAQCLGLALESMAMEIYGNIKESFHTSQGSHTSLDREQVELMSYI